MFRGQLLRFLTLSGLIAAVVLALAGGAVARAAGPLSWSSPALVDHHRPYASRGSLDAVSCPSVKLCVAVDDAGGVIVSRRPGKGASSWREVYFRGAMTLGVSCPSAGLCAAVDDGGNVILSTKPASGSWRVVRVDHAQGLRGIACASRSLCVAFDTTRLFVSTDPASRASSWRAVRVEPARSVCQPGSPVGCGPQEVMAVSCPSRSFCAAVDNAGNVVTSTRPTGGRGGWRSVRVDTSAPSPTRCLGSCSAFMAISCSSRSLCVAGDSSGNLFVSTRPRGGSSAWRSWYATPSECSGCAQYPVRAIACPSVRFCAALDDWGNVIASRHPARGAQSWKVTRAPTNLPFPYHTYALACPSTALCVTLRNPNGQPTKSNALVSTDPLGGTSTWRLETIPTAGYNRLQAISCPSVSLCVAADNAGHLITSTRPAGGLRAWVRSQLTNGVPAVSCPSVSFCAAVDKTGGVLTSHRPANGARAWTRTMGPSGQQLGGLSCPTASLCVGFSGNTILTASNPAGGPGAWTAQYSAYGQAPECGKGGPPFNCPVPADISGLYCKSANLCVALDKFGAVLSSTEPTAGSGAWQTRALGSSCYYGTCNDSVSCPSVSFCVASGSGNYSYESTVFTSINPGGGEWSTDTPNLPARSSPPALSPESCPNAQLCVGINSNGDFLVSTNPARSWTTGSVKHHDFFDPYYGDSVTLGPTGVSCPSTSLCISVDALGNVIAGTRTPVS
jgi:hypothetical protein